MIWVARRQRRPRYRKHAMGVVEANPDGGGDLPAGLDGCSQRTTHRRHLQGPSPAVLPARLGRNRAQQLRVLCYQYGGGEGESGLVPLGSPENWRCVVLEKLRKVELLDGSWKTAPNHSRPATCVIEADIDAEDQRPIIHWRRVCVRT